MMLALATVSLSAASAPLTYPDSPRRPVEDPFHGVKVSEDYRWLEQTGDAEVVRWIAAQNQLTRQVIAALPQRKAIGQELLKMTGGGPVSRHRFDLSGGRLPTASRLYVGVMVGGPSDLRSCEFGEDRHLAGNLLPARPGPTNGPSSPDPEPDPNRSPVCTWH
jgi:hypothetical protein